MSEERATYTAGEQPGEQERDPLRLALVAIQAFDQQLKDYETSGLAVDQQSLYRRAQLYTLWALAGEVRVLRYVLEGESDETGDA